MSRFVATLRRQFGPLKSNQLVRQHRRFARSSSDVLHKLSESARPEYWGDGYWIFFELLSYELCCSLAALEDIEPKSAAPDRDGFRMRLRSIRCKRGYPMIAEYRPNRKRDGVLDLRPWELSVKPDYLASCLRVDKPHLARLGTTEQFWGSSQIQRPMHVLVENAHRIPLLAGMPLSARNDTVVDGVRSSLNAGLDCRSVYYGEPNQILVPIYIDKRPRPNLRPDAVVPVNTNGNIPTVFDRATPGPYAHARMLVSHSTELPDWLRLFWPFDEGVELRSRQN